MENTQGEICQLFIGDNTFDIHPKEYTMVTNKFKLIEKTKNELLFSNSISKKSLISDDGFEKQFIKDLIVGKYYIIDCDDYTEENQLITIKEVK